MTEFEYVDWEGLTYYDSKLKEYVHLKDKENVKNGGDVTFEGLPDPSEENLNYIYRITEDFKADRRFEKSQKTFFANTWFIVYYDKPNSTFQYKYRALNDHTGYARSADVAADIKDSEDKLFVYKLFW